MDKNYKLIIVLISILISLCSCNKDVSTKDMIGVWECTNEQNRYFVFLPNDSCIIINYPDLARLSKTFESPNNQDAEWGVYNSSNHEYPSTVSFFRNHSGMSDVIYYCPFCSRFYIFVGGIDDEPCWYYLRVTDTIPGDLDAFIKNHDRSNLHNCWMH